MNPDTSEFLDGYNEWYNSLSPAGGAAEMDKIKGGKMKEWIKRWKEIYKNSQTHLDLIAEIESVEANIESIQDKNEEIQALQVEIIVLRTREEYIKQLEDEIGKLKRQKVLDVAYYDTKLKQMQAVREAAKELNDVLYSGRTVSVNELQQTRKKFQQALAAKDKDA